MIEVVEIEDAIPALDEATRLWRSQARWVVAVDGRSGSGKTTLGTVLAQRWGAQLVHMDDLYPGWEGLARSVEIVETQVLAEDNPGYFGWDWVKNVPTGWHALDPRAPLVVEGVGSYPRGVEDRVFGIEIVAPEWLRRQRALARDPGFVDFWEMWAAQEEQYSAYRGRPDVEITVLPPAR